MTTLDQRLVTRKNRKVRLLRELVPGIDVQIVYRRDYQHLLAKYGLEAPSQAADAKPPRAVAAEADGLLAGARLEVGTGARQTKARPVA